MRLCRDRLLVAIWLTLGMSIGLLQLPSNVHAQGSFDNATVADLALKYNGGFGGRACEDAGSVSSYNPGECKEFVRCIIRMVSNGQMVTAPGYYDAYARNGTKTASTDALKGDIIQLNDPNNREGFKEGMHTAIVVANLGNGNFDVIDSNFNKDYIARHHTWNPFHTASQLGLEVNIWRLGKVDSPPPPPPPPSGSSDRAPFGPLDVVTKSSQGAFVGGWAIDPDTTGPINIHVYVDNQIAAMWPANGFRPDVGAAFPGYGDWHGYGGYIGMGAGWHSVCAYAINYGFSAGNPQLGCKSVYVIPGDNPVGPFDGYTPLSGAVHAYGWMIDPNTAESGRVHVYADGRFVAEWQANASRPDVAAAFPGYGDRHGYGGLLFLSPGWRNVCIYGINLHAGGNDLLGCRSVNVPPPAGYGHPYGRSFEFEDAYNRAGREGGIGTAINYAKWWGPGCNQDFAGGAYGRATIMQRGCWGPAFAVKGANFHYLANRWGGNASNVLGYPYNDDHRWGYGSIQDFDGGQLGHAALMYGDRVGRTHLVFGGIWAAYRSLGGADGRLGHPVSDEYAWYGEVHQGFEGGWIQWTPSGWRVVWK